MAEIEIGKIVTPCENERNCEMDLIATEEGIQVDLHLICTWEKVDEAREKLHKSANCPMCGDYR